MNLDTLLKNACEDWSEEARVPAGLADRALRRHARRRSLKVVLAATSTALLVGAGVVVVAATGPTRQPAPPAARPTKSAAVRQFVPSGDRTLRTDPGGGLPRQLVAAGHTALAAYYTESRVPVADGPRKLKRTWYLYNRASGRYEKTPWTYLAVAPGMKQAAVLDGPLPTTRVSLLDLKTQKVIRWLPVGHAVGGMAWSPDGRRLVLTAYSSDPDAFDYGAENERTGYYVVDAASGQSVFRPLVSDGDNPSTRQDLGWSRDGTLLWAPLSSRSAKKFFEPDGTPRNAPAQEDDHAEEAGLAGPSPDGTLMPKSGPSPGPAVTITDVTTGKVVTVLPIEQALAWADDDHLIALGCEVKKCAGKGEYRNRLLLVGLDGRTTPLTGYHQSDLGPWRPVFTRR